MTLEYYLTLTWQMTDDGVIVTTIPGSMQVQSEAAAALTSDVPRIQLL